jgi:signal transduction histidine kinase
LKPFSLALSPTLAILPLLPLLFGGVSCKQINKTGPVVLSPDYKKGVSFLNSHLDSAYFYLNKVTTGSKDSLQIAQAYNVMAVVQNREGDYYGAQEALLTSLKYLHLQLENDAYCLVADYNVLGTTSLNLKHYDVAIGFYDSVERLARDTKSKTIAANNKAKVYQERGDYARATAIYERIVGESRKDKKEYARVLCNLATARWQQDSNYHAAPELLAALKIREETADDWGLNSSYAHLADYYSRSRPDSALVFAKDMYQVATRLESPDDQLEALEKLITLSPPKAIKPYFITYRKLKDSLETARSGAKNQFALVRYEAQKNKTDNLRLQQENANKEVQIVKQRTIGTAGVVIFLTITIWGVLWDRRRKQKMLAEQENAIREQRLQLSQKVHDRVANGLYQLMAEMQSTEGMEAEKVLDRIDLLYQQSRDISYEPSAFSGGDFAATITGLLIPFGTPERKVLIAGNDETQWAHLKPLAKAELTEVLRELLVNMHKHSRARNVVVKFDWQPNGLKIQYIDDGVGFPPLFRPGNGLTSTGNRIAAIGGQIIFDRNTPSGVSIRIFCPND